MNRSVGKVILGGVILSSALALARPVTNISAQRHPNLASAQQLSAQAWDKISAAQGANEWDMAGHAARAKELLDQVNTELKLAAEAANAKAK